MMIEIIQALNSITSLFNNSCDVNTVKYHQVGSTDWDDDKSCVVFPAGGPDRHDSEEEDPGW